MMDRGWRPGAILRLAGMLAALAGLAGGCERVYQALRQPCKCYRVTNRDEPHAPAQLAVDCDNVVFPSDFPTLPYKTPIIAFSHRHAGYQMLPAQMFEATGASVKKLDFSGNSIRRLTDGVLINLQSSLEELRLADNLLGDSLNPIFSSSEFHAPSQLKLLDLSGNQIKAIEEGLLKGCTHLQELRLDRNRLNAVPSASLSGPKALRSLTLSSNRIKSIDDDAFYAQPNLEKIDMSNNRLNKVAGGAFGGLPKLRKLKLGYNRLVHLNSDVFQGSSNVEQLDLSGNFFVDFPVIALRQLPRLKFLNISANLIEKLDNSYFHSLSALEKIDLSHNSIGNIAPATFMGLKNLKNLDLSVNMLRTIEDDAFEGLSSLETLSLSDNNILVIPGSALLRLPRLRSLNLDYNRIAALSADIFTPIADRVVSINLARNVIRELPVDAFQDFKVLSSLDLSGSLLLNIEAASFSGLEDTLLSLNLHGNRLSSLPQQPLTLHRLRRLDLSHNSLKELPRASFTGLTELMFLNLSNNPLLTSLPLNSLDPLSRLEVLDLTNTGMKLLSPDLLLRNPRLKWLSFASNMIQEIPELAFQSQVNVTSLDLSNNHISNIRVPAFMGLANLRKLNLEGNKLASFKGEFFINRRSNGTLLEEINLSNNYLSYLFPSSFKVHPRLKRINVSQNKFSFFPAELIATLEYLQEVDLSKNYLKTLEEFDFGRLPNLRTVDLSYNQIESISETAFHNSTQLQEIKLGRNKLEKLEERIFQGLVRLKLLDLQHNSLSDLPQTIFERSRLRILENINLSGNKFSEAPLKSLQKQYFFLMSVDLSHNLIKELPSDDSTMVNIKKLDLSFNKLSEDTIAAILGEPKTVRELNMAGTGITHLTRLETPFIQSLNVSHNNISQVTDKVFEKTTLIESIDFSHNLITDVGGSFAHMWAQMRNLRSLDLSSNPIQNILSGDLDNLGSLTTLKIANLMQCAKIEKHAFKSMEDLVHLEAYGYPKLGYLDVAGMLHYLPSLEYLDIEVKDSAIGSDQLSAGMNPRLTHLSVQGNRVQSISSGALAGLKSKQITIEFRNTTINNLPPSLLIPLPRSSKITLRVAGNQLSSISPQFLSALDDRRNEMSLQGLKDNPIHCDCNVRALRRSGLAVGIRCATPSYHANKLLMEIPDDELSCDPNRALKLTSTTTPPPPPPVKQNKIISRLTTEPEIIWSLPPPSPTTHKPLITAKPPSLGMQQINNDDTLIIGIVGGVVAFIAILIIIICIVRLRINNSPYPTGPLAPLPALMPPHCNNQNYPCNFSIPNLYAMTPQYNPSYASSLPPKMAVSPASVSPHLRASYTTLGRQPMHGQSQPYYISFPHEEKEYIS